MITPAAAWSVAERSEDLDRAERDGVDLLVVGGGITGAGILREAASRGLRSLLVERGDFASGTSSRSSKLIHGGLRYLEDYQFAVTREACRERDRLLRLDPHLVQQVPFLFPTYEDAKLPLWKIRTALLVYAALADFRRTARFQMLGPERVAALAPDLRRAGLRGAGLYFDAHVDDVRLVLETLKSARGLGGAAVNHAEVVAFERREDGRIAGAVVRDALAGRRLTVRAEVVVNAAGPAVERVRGLDRPVENPELRPTKGVHLVIPRARIRTDVAVTFSALDGRHLFLFPQGDVAWLGTTDSFTDEVDSPVVTIDEVHYLLSAVNAAFPGVGLTTNDLRSVFAGVRPLAARPDEQTPPSSVSREDRTYSDPSGLLSAAGGKLTTFRAMGERIVDRALDLLPADLRRRCGPSRTAELPLRADDFDRAELEAELQREFQVSRERSAHLVRSYGGEARALLRDATPEQRRPIGASRYTFAEIPWCVANECPANLCDLLERRLRVAIFAAGQGITELPLIAATAAAAAGWDPARTRAESQSYLESVRRGYQIVAESRGRTAA